jgi:hypothetical protein
METPTALVLLISLAVLFGLGIGGVAKALMFSKGNRGGQEGGGFFGSRRQQKGIASRKIAPNDATKARLEKTFADSASRTED